MNPYTIAAIIIGIFILSIVTGMSSWMVVERNAPLNSDLVTTPVMNGGASSTSWAGTSSATSSSFPIKPGPVYRPPVSFSSSYINALQNSPVVLFNKNGSSPLEAYVTSPSYCSGIYGSSTIASSTDVPGVWVCSLSSSLQGLGGAYKAVLPQTSTPSLSGAYHSTTPTIPRLCRPSASNPATQGNYDCASTEYCFTGAPWQSLTETSSSGTNYYGFCLPTTSTPNSDPMLGYAVRMSTSPAAYYSGAVWSTDPNYCYTNFPISSTAGNALYMCQGPIVYPGDIPVIAPSGACPPGYTNSDKVWNNGAIQTNVVANGVTRSPLYVCVPNAG
jgi:hypothetical protein